MATSHECGSSSTFLFVQQDRSNWQNSWVFPISLPSTTLRSTKKMTEGLNATLLATETLLVLNANMSDWFVANAMLRETSFQFHMSPKKCKNRCFFCKLGIVRGTQTNTMVKLRVPVSAYAANVVMIRQQLTELDWKFRKIHFFLHRSLVACSQSREVIWYVLYSHHLHACIAITSTRNSWCMLTQDAKNQNENSRG